MFADLHIHSWYSDGTLSIEEIIEKAKAQNITLISICDHECIDAYLNNANFHDIEIITGAEIIALAGGIEYHILAYGFDIQNKTLIDLLKYNRSILIEKGSKMIEKMSADYASISMDEFIKYERNRKNGGWDSIDYLKSKGIVENVPDYFELARKYYPPSGRIFLCASEVIKIIHGAGGYAVLAHPGDYTGQNPKACEEKAARFLSMGIDGFECYYTSHFNTLWYIFHFNYMFTLRQFKSNKRFI
jgi:predicted metal-dependent phosphoesterase TrpH